MNNDLMIQEKTIVDSVRNKVVDLANKGQLILPPNYSAENAMKSAWLILQETVDKDKNPALEVCTKDSIANSLLDMAIQGLSPAKKQCYFIVYGKQLQLQRSYFGTMAVTKRLESVKDINAQVIYEGDTIEIAIENGVKRIVKHEQDFLNIDTNKIKGVYCIITKHDGNVYTEIMNINQIYKAWMQSKTTAFEGKWLNGKNGKNYFQVNQPLVLDPNSTHAKFTDQMALKTVINRACKMFANTSDDSDLLVESFNRTTESEYENESDPIVEVQSQEVIKPTKAIDTSKAFDTPKEEQINPPSEQQEQTEIEFD